MTARLATLIVFFLLFTPMGTAGSTATDPCEKEVSNMDLRICYSKEQRRINARADSLASAFSSRLRKDAADYDARGDNVVADLLRKTARELSRSQQSWKAYRDQQCKAVAYSYTTGSGAGTAYEACMFQLGQDRVRELQDSFGQH